MTIFEWIFRLYCYEKKSEIVNVAFLAPVDVRSGGASENTRNTLLFRGTHDIDDKWSSTLGLRYCDDVKKFAAIQYVLADRTLAYTYNGSVLASLGFVVGARMLSLVEKAVSNTEVTPAVNLPYQWTDDLLVSGYYSEGFKGGGFTQWAFPPLAMALSFELQPVGACERGFKCCDFEESLDSSGAVSYSDYDDLQASPVDSRSGKTALVFRTAVKEGIQGAKPDLMLVPADCWLLEGGRGWVDPSFDEVDKAANEATSSSEFKKSSGWTSRMEISSEIGTAHLRLLNVGADVTAALTTLTKLWITRALLGTAACLSSISL